MGTTTYPSQVGYADQPPITATSVLADGALTTGAVANVTVTGTGSPALLYAGGNAAVFVVNGISYSLNANSSTITYPISGSVAASVTPSYSAPATASWASSTMPSGYWTSVAYGVVGGTGYYVAVAGEGSAGTTAAYSTDGVTWTASVLPVSATWNSVAFGVISGTPYFIAIAGGYRNPGSAAAYSTNGTTWTAMGSMPSSQHWSQVCFGNGMFVAVAGNGGTTNAAAYSTNGTTWTAATMPSSNYWSAVAYGVIGGVYRFVAVSGGINSANISAYSTNGTTWTAMGALPSSSGWCSVAFGNNYFLAVSGSNGTSTAGAISYDGLVWVAQTIPGIYWQSLTYGNGYFIGVGGEFGAANTTSYYSLDGITWNSTTLPSSTTWSSITVGLGKFFAVAGGDAGGVTSGACSTVKPNLPVSFGIYNAPSKTY